MDNYDTLSFRVRSRITPRRGLNINLSFITRDNNNPGVADEELLGVPEFDVDISSRTFTSSLDWSPGSRFWLNAGYTYQHLTSDVGIIFNPGGVGTAALGRDQYYLRDHFFFFNASVELHRRVSFYAGYRGHDDRGQGDRETDDGAGLFVRSFPLRFQSPEAALHLPAQPPARLDGRLPVFRLQGKFPRPLPGPVRQPGLPRAPPLHVAPLLLRAA